MSRSGVSLGLHHPFLKKPMGLRCPERKGTAAPESSPSPMAGSSAMKCLINNIILEAWGRGIYGGRNSKTGLWVPPREFSFPFIHRLPLFLIMVFLLLFGPSHILMLILPIWGNFIVLCLLISHLEQQGGGFPLLPEGSEAS